MKKSLLAGLVAVTPLAASLSFASTTGFYVGGGAGQSAFSGDINRQIASAYQGNGIWAYRSSVVKDDSDTGWKLFAGYRFLPWLSVELGWQDLGNVRTNYVLDSIVPLTNATATVDGTYRISGPSFSLVGEVPFNDRLSGLLRVGAFRGEVEYSEAGIDGLGVRYTFHDKERSTTTTAGIGLLWRVTSRVDLRLDYDRYFGVGERFALTGSTNGRFDHVDLLSLNVGFRFGG